MKHLDLVPLTLHETSCWYGHQYFTDLTICQQSRQEIVEYMQNLQNRAAHIHSKALKSNQEGRVKLNYQEKIVKSGTRSDKMALYVLRLKESPFVYVDDLAALYEEFSKSKRAVTDYMGSIMDAADTLTPKDRLLITLDTRLNSLPAGQIYKSEDTLAMMYFENKLIEFLNKCFQFVVLECAQDQLPQLRTLAVEFMGAFSKYLSFYKPAVKFLIQKLGDVEDKTAKQALDELMKLESTFSQTQAVIEVIQFLRDNQEKLNDKEPKVKQSAMRCLHQGIIFVNKQIGKFNNKKLNTDVADLMFLILKKQLRLEDGINIKKYQVSEFGLVKQVLQVLSKLFSFMDFTSIQFLENHVKDLIKITAVAQFNICVLIAQLLVKLIQAVYQEKSQVIDQKLVHQICQHLLQLMYDLSQRFDLLTVNNRSKFTLFLRLILQLNKTLTDGIMLNKQLFASLWKRLIQQTLMATNPECVCNTLLVLQLGAQLNLKERLRLQQIQQSFVNTVPFNSPFKSLGHDFNFTQENPVQTKAVDDQAYEMLLLKNSYHPSIQLFADNFLKKKHVEFVDVEKQMQQLIKEKKIKQQKETDAKVEVEQPFGFYYSSSMMMGDVRYLTDKGKHMYNQVHLEKLHELFVENKDSQTKVREEFNNDIDDIIMKDLLKKGIVKKDAKFNEMSKLLKDDPEYQKMIAETEANREKLTDEQIRAMDGVELLQEQGEEYGEEFGEEDEEEFEVEEQKPEKEVKQRLPTMMSADEYFKMRDAKLKKMEEEAKGKDEDNSGNPLFKAMMKRAKQ
ncbi:CCAAT-box-binding_transcription factor [Hexamita inflata]|uniref:CCAAT-box-binding transcription factor n=1 Tax=Hexamita inflata TaxID=28002 RepID=A0AA86QY79_9EUKA|nr:CCAAT-box-binding transcription factor [Hexamita inflata]